MHIHYRVGDRSTDYSVFGCYFLLILTCNQNNTYTILKSSSYLLRLIKLTIAACFTLILCTDKQGVRRLQKSDRKIDLHTTLDFSFKDNLKFLSNCINT